ncbi:MAG TPA: glycosyltransferase family 39 protein [Saprospiraceae bacterium]|nr:glycosyltransferase family 39 protein [Saprospiraceae bacterium]
MNKQVFSTIGLITFVSGLVFVPFLGAIPLFDWDEVNFAEVAREMILTGDYSRPYIDFALFWEKPPLFFWLQAMSMQFWGIGEFAARFPNAVCGIVTLNILYLIGRRLYDDRFGVLWVLAYGGSVLPHLYFRSGIIDPWFNLFIFLCLHFLIQSQWIGRPTSSSLVVQSVVNISKRSSRPLRLRVKFFDSLRVEHIFAGIFLGLAVLTKGPVAYLIVLLVVGVYWVIKRFRSPLSLKNFILFSVIAAFTFGIWYGVETIKNGTWFITEFTRYQIDLLLRPGAGHAGFPGYHVVVLLLGCFPASIMAVQPFLKKSSHTEAQRTRRESPRETDLQIEFNLWMKILMVVVIVVFSLVQSKIVHYSSLCYFPITFLATLYVHRLIEQGRGVGGWQKAGIVAIGLLYVMAGITLVYFGKNPEVIEELITLDQNAMASLTLDITWEWWHVLPVCFLLIGVGGVLYIRETKVMRAVMLLYVSMAAFVYTGTACWVGKVQQYTQGPETEFFSSLAGKDVYVIPWGHKSYSQYWDFRKPMPNDFIMSNSERNSSFAEYSDPDFLLTSPELDKDVYVITKVSMADDFLTRYPDLKRIGNKGGVVFFMRKLKRD